MATTFNMRITGLAELQRALENAGKNMPKELKDAMNKSTVKVKNDARKIKAGSFKNQTGNLRRSIFRNVTVTAGDLKGIVATDQKYSKYVEFGTRPHTILPKRGKYLAFKGSTGIVFARKVNHPGSKPYPFMKPALEDNIKNITNFFDTAIKRIVMSL